MSYDGISLRSNPLRFVFAHTRYSPFEYMFQLCSFPMVWMVSGGAKLLSIYLCSCWEHVLSG